MVGRHILAACVCNRLSRANVAQNGLKIRPLKKTVDIKKFAAALDINALHSLACAQKRPAGR
jgi:hypothetical protein